MKAGGLMYGVLVVVADLTLTVVAGLVLGTVLIAAPMYLADRWVRHDPTDEPISLLTDD